MYSADKIIVCENNIIVSGLIKENDSDWLYKIRNNELVDITPENDQQGSYDSGSAISYENAIYYFYGGGSSDNTFLYKYDLASNEKERISVSHIGSDLCAGNNCVYVYEYASNPLICYDVLEEKEYSIPLDNQ